MADAPMDPRAQALLDAHVAFWRAQCQGQALRRQIRVQIEGLLDDAGGLPLARLLDADTVKSWAVYVVRNLDLGPDLATLVGRIARRLYEDPIQQETTLADVLPDAALEVFVDQLLELHDLRRALVTEFVGNPLYASLISEVLLHALRDYLAKNEALNKLPGAKSALKLGRGLMDRAKPGLGDQLDAQLRQFAQRETQASLKTSERFLHEHLDDDTIRDAVRQVWERLREEPLAGYRALVTAQQVEDLAMVGTAYWREFRQTDYLAAMLEAGVEAFYERHADTPVQAVLAELGVTRELLRTGLSQLLPELLRNLEQAGLLDAIIRRLLVEFYASDEMRAVLDAL